MAVHSTVPLTITPEAAARVAELGMQAELERMLEHTYQTVPDLQRIEVVLEPPYDTGDDLGITIEATKLDRGLADDPTDREWSTWQVITFPPDVCQCFRIWVIYGSADAR